MSSVLQTDPVKAAGSAQENTRRRTGVFGAVTRTAKDWLDRPMTSWHLILAIFVLLLGFGLLMVLSASSVTAYQENPEHPSAFGVFLNQAIYAVVGLVGFVFAARLAPRAMRAISFPAVLFSLVMLAAVLVVGKKTYGARSWIQVGSITFQPSEVAKLALLLWMAHVLAARRHNLGSLKTLLIPVLPAFILMVALLMLEPDLGTTASLTIVFFAALWFAGAPMWMFASLITLGGAGMAYLATSAGYRSDRVQCWLEPTYQQCYQLYQGMFGMGHGGLFGAGLGQSLTKWQWLPNADSDFIFAIIGEELGLVGTGLLLVLFGMLAYTGIRIARRNIDPFIKIVAATCTVWLVGQAAINIGYVIGLLPVTGLTLPMISKGGTSLIITMVVFGLLANFARREPHAAAAIRSQGPGRFARFLGLGTADADGTERGPSKRQLRKAARRAARSERQRAASRVQYAQRGLRAAREDPRGQGSKAPRPATARRQPARRQPPDRPFPDRQPADRVPTDRQPADRRPRPAAPSLRRSAPGDTFDTPRTVPRGAAPRGSVPPAAPRRTNDPRRIR